MTATTMDETKSNLMDELLEKHAQALHITYYCRTAGDNTFLGFAAAFLWEMKDIGWDYDFSQVPMNLVLRHANAMEKTYREQTEGDNTWTGLLFMLAHDVLDYLHGQKNQ